MHKERVVRQGHKVMLDKQVIQERKELVVIQEPKVQQDKQEI